MSDKEKCEPAGFVHKFFGEQVPGGFYWVLLDVEYNKDEPIVLAEIPDSWFVDQWRGAILGKESEVIKPSPKGAPEQRGRFTSYDGRTKNMYSLTLKCFETLEEAEEYVKIGQYTKYPTYDWTWHSDSHSTIDFVKKSKKIHDDRFDAVRYYFNPLQSGKSWFDEFPKFNPPSPEQTEQQRIAQRQVDLNSARITKLEKELKDLRELQKLLKGMR